jgi:hypothetical protein
MRGAVFRFAADIGRSAKRALQLLRSCGRVPRRLQNVLGTVRFVSRACTQFNDGVPDGIGAFALGQPQ